MPKILLLHGFLQNAKIFSNKISVLRKMLTKNGFELVYGEGQKVIFNENGLSDPDTEQRGWWNATDNNYEGYNESREYLKILATENGGFDGILGFSQGATMAALIASELNPKFLVIVSGFVPKDIKLLKDLDYAGDIFHVMGNNDLLVDKQLSLDLASVFQSKYPGKSKILLHDGGHQVPLKSAYKQEIYDWIVEKLSQSS